MYKFVDNYSKIEIVIEKFWISSWS